MNANLTLKTNQDKINTNNNNNIIMVRQDNKGSSSNDPPSYPPELTIPRSVRQQPRRGRRRGRGGEGEAQASASAAAAPQDGSQLQGSGVGENVDIGGGGGSVVEDAPNVAVAAGVASGGSTTFPGSTRRSGRRRGQAGTTGGGGGGGRVNNNDDANNNNNNDNNPFHASFRRRATQESIGLMSFGATSAGSDVMTVDMQGVNSSLNSRNNNTRGEGVSGGGRGGGGMGEEVGGSINVQRTGSGGAGRTGAGLGGGIPIRTGHPLSNPGDNPLNTGNNNNNPGDNNEDDMNQHPNEEEKQEQQHRRRRRQRDRADFRTSITASMTSATRIHQGSGGGGIMGTGIAPHDLVSSTDENPNFWAVSDRWFSDANEFVGELTGMATRRATIDDQVAGLLPKVEGVEIVSAVDDDDEEEEEDGDKWDGLNDSVSVDDDERIGLNTYPSDIEDASTPLFDELSSLGDTPTAFFTVVNARAVIRGAWLLSALFILAWIAADVGVRRSNWFQGLNANNGNGHGRGHGVTMFGPPTSTQKTRLSKRYKQLRSKLMQISGEQVLFDEDSPQHKALLYLADGDALVLNPHDESATTQLLQRYALAVFYFSTGGPGWKSRTYWLTGRHECGWLFVICSDIEKGQSDYVDRDEDDDYSSMLDSELGLGEGRIVTGLSLYGQGLKGTIPKEIEMLEYLHVLDLGNNALEGIIGTEFGRLQHLHKLYLENNNLKGGVEAMAWLSSLKRVNLENNQLSGTMPYDMGKLKHLEEVRMGKNNLQGSIPSSLFRSKTLTKLDLHENAFNNAFDIHPASVLQYLYLHGNELTGTVSSTALCAVSDTLVDLRLNNNNFTGKLPNLDCTMERLELLSLAENELTGHIHEDMGDKLPRLKEVHLYENKLLSTVPGSLFRPENLTAVLLGNNALTGSLTADMVNDARNLAHLYVNNNKMSGNLDDFAGASNLNSLKKLRLEFNNFSGTIPKMNVMKTLELLYLYNNSLTGSLDNLSGSVNLRKLRVSNNNLEGNVASELGHLKRLEVLSLDGNNFEGTLPTELQQLVTLQELQIERNNFSGSVPRGVCDLRKASLKKLVSDCGGRQPAVSCACCTQCL